MNVWFGTSWGAPVNLDTMQVPVPVGVACLWCDELIAEDDSGWGEREHGDHWMHIECFGRQIVGSVSHQLRVCSCYGGPWEDSPLLSKREAAMAAWVLSQELIRDADD